MKILKYLIYPCTILSSTAFYLFLLNSNDYLNLGLSAKGLLAIFLGIIQIVFFEYLIPFKKEWSGFKKDFFDDVIYTLMVQKIIPFLAKIIWVYLLVEILSFNPIKWNYLWQKLNILNQFLIILLIGEFGKYWVHRLAHEKNWFWKYHAVHHSVERLYWLNTSRFHPVDKLIQLFSESLLFYLVGVPVETVILYEVFYSVNGFFQHCNIDIRLGFLNRVISSVEQHRYHHSRKISESNTNYGNKLSIYDQLFGTYFLPDSHGPKNYGLKNKNYPMNIWPQLWAPLFLNLDQFGSIPKNPFLQLVLRTLLKVKVNFAGKMILFKYWKTAKFLKSHQESLVLEIVKKNMNTTFGIQNNFKEIKSIEDFKSLVNIQNYEDVRELILKQDLTNNFEILNEQIIFFSTTSGTTGEPKFIPISKNILKTYKEIQNLWLYFTYKNDKKIFEGSLVTLVGAKIEGQTPSGKNFGATSGHIQSTLPKVAKYFYAIPNEVFMIKNHRLKYFIILRIILEKEDLTFLSTANPSTLNLLQNITNQYKEIFVQDLKLGTFTLPADIETFENKKTAEEILVKILKPNLVRSKFLETIIKKHNSLPFSLLFPNLSTIACWQSGGCRLAFEELQRNFKDKEIIWRDIGFLSSEFRGSIPHLKSSEAGIPTFIDYFFEFIPEEEMNNKNPKTLNLNEIKKGQKYSIIVTSKNGLYRYFMNDIIKVHDSYLGVPLISFDRKGKGVTSITGEKLYEGQFLEAISKFNLKVNFCNIKEALALADFKNSNYKILIECDGHISNEIEKKSINETLDLEISNCNIEYKEKRLSERLKKPNVYIMKKGFFDFIRSQLANEKGRDSQIKILAVSNLEEFNFKWKEWIENEN